MLFTQRAMAQSDSDELVARSDSDELVVLPRALSDSDELVARSDSDELVARSDSDELVARSDSDELVARSDSDELVARRHSNELVARLLYGELQQTVAAIQATNIRNTNEARQACDDLPLHSNDRNICEQLTSLMDSPNVHEMRLKVKARDLATIANNTSERAFLKLHDTYIDGILDTSKPFMDGKIWVQFIPEDVKDTEFLKSRGEFPFVHMVTRTSFGHQMQRREFTPFEIPIRMVKEIQRVGMYDRVGLYDRWGNYTYKIVREPTGGATVMLTRQTNPDDVPTWHAMTVDGGETTWTEPLWTEPTWINQFVSWLAGEARD